MRHHLGDGEPAGPRPRSSKTMWPARSRTASPRCRASSTSTPRADAHHHRRVRWKAHARRWTRASWRGRPAGDVRDPIITKSPARAVLAFTVASPWTTRRCRGCDNDANCSPGGAPPRGRGDGRCSGARPLNCRRWRRRPMSRTAPGATEAPGRTDRAAASNPCARWPRCRPPEWRA